MRKVSLSDGEWKLILLRRLVRRRRVWLFAALGALLLAAVCAGCAHDSGLKTATLTYESAGGDGLLVCTEGEGESSETVQVRHNDLLSSATLSSLRQGDQMIVRYRNRTAGEIDAVEITLRPVAPQPPSASGQTQSPAPPEATDDTPAPPETADDVPAPPEAADDDPSHASEDEAAWIAYFQDTIFGGTAFNFYRQALSSTYESAADVNLFELFYNGFGQSTVLSDMELHTLFSNSAPELDVIRVSGTEMDDALRRYFGIGLADTNRVGLDEFRCIPELDTYYLMHSDTNALLPIEVTHVRTDADGYYYVTYVRTESDPREAPLLCCLHQTDGRWQIVYNIPETESPPSGASAQRTDSGTPHLAAPIVLGDYGRADQPDAFDSSRYLISSDLDDAVSCFLFQEIADFAPKNCFRRRESHRLLALKHQDGRLYVYLVGLMQAESDGDIELVQQNLLLPVKLCFTPYASSGRVFYELTDVAYAEDPERPGDIFPDVIGTETLTDEYWQALEQEISNREPDYHKTMFRDEDAYFACCAGWTPDEALRNVQTMQALHAAIRSCQIIGTKENEKAAAQMEEEFPPDAALDACAMDITCSIEWDRTRYPDDNLPDDGVYITTAYLCQDPGSGVWRVMRIAGQTKLFDYTGRLSKNLFFDSLPGNSNIFYV